MPKKPPAKPAAPSVEEDAERVLRDSLLFRNLRVVGRVGDDGGIEVAEKPGHYLSVICRTTADGQRVLRVLAGPVRPLTKAPPQK